MGVLGDREFASGKLFEFFNKNQLPFYIRIKEGFNVKAKDKKFYTAQKLFSGLNLRGKSEFQISIRLYG